MEVTSGDPGRALSRRSTDREPLCRKRSGTSREPTRPRRQPGSEAPGSGPQPRTSLSRRAQDFCDAKGSCILEPWPCRRYYRRCGPAERLRLVGSLLHVDRPEYRLPPGGTDEGQRALSHCGQLSFDGVVEEVGKIVAGWVGGVLYREILDVVPKFRPDMFELRREFGCSFALEELDHRKFQNEVLDRKAIPHFPKLHEPDGVDHTTLLDVLDVYVKVRLEPLLLAGRTIQERVGLFVVREPTGNNVDVEINAAGFLATILQPQRRVLRFDNIRSCQRRPDIVVDIFQGFTRARIVVREVADDVEVVRVADHRSLRLRTSIANRWRGVLEAIAEQLLHLRALLLERLEFITVVCEGLGGQHFG